MDPASQLLDELKTAGVKAVADGGILRLRGDREALHRVADCVRGNKDALLDVLLDAPPYEYNDADEWGLSQTTLAYLAGEDGVVLDSATSARVVDSLFAARLSPFGA